MTEETTRGARGIPARWTSSAKCGVGTAIGDASRVWFTLSHGIFNEIYYPRVDQACIRDLGLIVTDGAGFFSEEKRDAHSGVRWLAAGVPAFGLINTCRKGRYRIEKEIVSDPHRSTVLQQVRFIALQGTLADYHLYVLLSPHLGNQGANNTAWFDQLDDRAPLLAQREGASLALACSVDWLKRSAGYVGSSDGFQDLRAHKELTLQHARAENGNVALTAEVDLGASRGSFLLALGFGEDPEEAAQNANASVRDGFERAKADYIGGWRAWAATHDASKGGRAPADDLSAISLAVLRSHESKTAPGALIASLAIPWGFSKGDQDLGGYHLVWARDMVEAAGGFLAAGAHDDARRALSYLRTAQHSDGHWAQNTWLDGSPYWDGIQMDETALPVLLVDLLRRERALSAEELAGFWPMVRLAAGYLVRNGPVSPQDRWEEDPGYTPFTIGAEIAALLAAAELADLLREANIATYLREVADIWHSSLDRWMFASGTDWCRRFEVNGYYVRITPVATSAGLAPFQRLVNVKNVSSEQSKRLAAQLISPDALALVRFGLRAADDPRIADTTTVIDAVLQIETPTGPTWHRYNDDGYGEHQDGSPFDGTGIGRGWPLLTGERAHFELAAGRVEKAKLLLQSMASFANDGGLIPEQVWDSADLPERELYRGRPSGSAMPLVWAHAEYLKLQRSIRDGRVFDLPPQTVQRYLVEKTVSPRLSWRFNHKLRSVPTGMDLRIETLVPADVRFSLDDWRTIENVSTRDVGLGIHIADLTTRALPEGSSVRFTFFWLQAQRWESKDFDVRVTSS